MQVAGRHNERVSSPRTLVLSDSYSGQGFKVSLDKGIVVFARRIPFYI